MNTSPQAGQMEQMLKDVSLTPDQSESLLGNQTNWMDFKEAAAHIKRVISTHTTEVESRVKDERQTRNMDFDIEKLRGDKKLLTDETFIPVRICDTNIKRETPRYVSYLLGGRLISLQPDGGEAAPKVIESLEKRHHQLMTYPGWLEPWFSVIDGACSHGVDYLEVVYDISYPGHVAIEHVGVSNLIIPQKVRSVQQASVILRRYEVTADDLRVYRDKFGFTSVDELFQYLPPACLREGEVTELYKVFFRINGVVHVAWWHEKLNDKYVKDPAPADLGIREKVMVGQPPVRMAGGGPMTGMPIMIAQPQPPTEQWNPVQLREYPVVAYRYYLTEETKLGEAKGRVYADKHYQSALSTSWSAVVNAQVRSSGVYASRGTAGTQTKISAATVVLQHGQIYDTPLNFFSPPPPHTDMLPMMSMLGTLAVQEAGHFNYATNTKGGKTRPTATEVQSSENTTQEFSSVGLAMFSETVRAVYTLTWRILSSLAEQDEIFLYGNRSLQMDETGVQLIETVQNDKVVVKQPYLIKAAGDVDVIQRSQRIQKLLQFWPLVAGTPLAGPYLSKMLRIALPEDGEQFASIIEQTSGIPPVELIGRLLAVVKASLGPEDLQGQPPEALAQLQQLLTVAEQYVTTSTTNSAPQSGVAQPPANP